jgi:hypothetical protein
VIGLRLGRPGRTGEHGIWMLDRTSSLRLDLLPDGIVGQDGMRLMARYVRVVINDTVEGFQNSVRQPVLPQELPDIFLVVEFEYAWRELSRARCCLEP